MARTGERVREQYRDAFEKAAVEKAVTKPKKVDTFCYYSCLEYGGETISVTMVTNGWMKDIRLILDGLDVWYVRRVKS